jgi:hypothetical protein
MSRLLSSPDFMPDVCSTCRGVLRLQARWTRVQGTGETRRQRIERMAEEARWFVLTLEKVRPCPSHRGVLRLACHLTDELETVELSRGTRMECAS